MLSRVTVILLTGLFLIGVGSAYIIPGDVGFEFLRVKSFTSGLHPFECVFAIISWLLVIIGPVLLFKVHAKSLQNRSGNMHYSVFFWRTLYDLQEFRRFFLRGSTYYIGFGFGRFVGSCFLQGNADALSLLFLVSGVSILFGANVSLRPR